MNLENLTFINAQLNRLQVLKGPPRGEEALQDYSTVLLRAETEEIVRSTIDDFVFHATDCPKPTELRDVINRKNDAYREEKQGAEKKIGCKACKFTGWIVSYWLVTTGQYKTTRQRIPEIVDLTTEMEYKEKLSAQTRPEGSPEQEVYSGAEPCNCRQAAGGDQ